MTLSNSPIKIALDKAHASGIQFPKLRLSSYVFSRAPEKGRNSGAVYVKRSSDGEYLGKIVGLAFFLFNNYTLEEVVEIKKLIEEGVESAAQAYGLLTGNCSCCGRLLTAKESVGLGIGPICREKFGFSVSASSIDSLELSI